MKENRKLIYDFTENGLYYKESLPCEEEKTITLTIDTLQMDIDYSTGAILSVTGFCPLFKAKKTHIAVPQVIGESFFVQVKDVEYKKGVAYDYFKFFPESETYFLSEELPILTYDDENQKILLGTTDIINDKYVTINENIIGGIDIEGNLKSLLISFDATIQ